MCLRHQCAKPRMRTSRTIRATVSALVVLFSFWGSVHGHIECRNDESCPNHQYCYEHGLCVNYTNCDHYNRELGSIRPRYAKQCGKCKSGYSAETLADGKEDDACRRNESKSRKNESSREQDEVIPDNTLRLIGWIIPSITFVCVGIIILTRCYRHEAKKDRKPLVLNSPTHPKTDANGNKPSAPPYSEESLYPESRMYIYENQNDESAKLNPLAVKFGRIDEISTESERPRNARAYQPPSYVRTDRTYCYPEEYTVNEEVDDHSPSLNDEDTMPSAWTSGDPLTSISGRPFAEVGNEQRENAANDALTADNAACLYTGTAQGHREMDQEGGSASSSSSRTNEHFTTENARRINAVTIQNRTSIHLNIINENNFT